MSRTVWNRNNFTAYFIVASSSSNASSNFVNNIVGIQEIESNNSISSDILGTQYISSNYYGWFAIKVTDLVKGEELCYITGDTTPTNSSWIHRNNNCTVFTFTYNNEKYITSNTYITMTSTTTIQWKLHNTGYTDLLSNITIENGTIDYGNIAQILNAPCTLDISITPTITANTGYKFNSNPTFSVTILRYQSDSISVNRTGSGTDTEKTFSSITLSRGSTSYYTPSTISITSDIIIDEQGITVTNNLTNCTITQSPTTITKNESVTFTITANEGYYFVETPTLTDDTGTQNYTINDDNNTATITITVNSNITNNANCNVTITIISSSLNNCTLSYTPTTPIKGQNINFTLTANTGYEFTNDNIPYIEYTESLGQATTSFTINDDTATLTFDTSTLETATNPIIVHAIATLKSEVPTTSYSFVNVYVLDETQLKELGKHRFYVANANSPVNLVDLGEYICSLKRFYCDIPINTDVEQNIVLGNIDTGISCKLVSADFVSLDCGNVTINSTNNNENDYNNIVYAILPFIGQMTLEANLIMNRTINIKYSISNITGDCVCFITDTETNTILYTFNGNISENFPYIINNILWELKGEFNNQSSVLYGFTPTIVIIYNDNYNENGLYNDEKYGVISEITKGLCEIDNVTLIDTNTLNNDELNDIIAKLHNGVIFE